MSSSKVVEIGDALFGSTVASLNFSDLGLDVAGSGNLAFTYGLADGRNGVAMATPGAGLPTIFQDPAGKIPVPDSVGINWVPVADFSGRNLTKAWLVGADLQSANGRNVNLTSAVMRGADLTNADLSGANLRGAVLDTARLNGAILSGAQVRGARFEREFLPVIDSCFIVFCSTPKAVGYGGITPAQLASTASYQAHDLSGMNLAGNDFSNLNLAGQNLTGSNFTLATLTGVDLTGAEIRQASFGRYPISATLETPGFAPGSPPSSARGSRSTSFTRRRAIWPTTYPASTSAATIWLAATSPVTTSRIQVSTPRHSPTLTSPAPRCGEPTSEQTFIFPPMEPELRRRNSTRRPATRLTI